MTSPLTTHVLDTSRGEPARGVDVVCEQWDAGRSTWSGIGGGATDQDGRHRGLVAMGSLRPGRYRLIFSVGAYFRQQGIHSYFYEYVPVDFVLSAPVAHYHVPLLISPFGYSTYRGS